MGLDPISSRLITGNERIVTAGSTPAQVPAIQGEQKEIPPSKGELPINKEELQTKIKGLNDFLSTTKTALKFQLHEKLNEYYVTIIDENTKQVVREVPSKKLLDMYAAMQDLMGILIDKKI